MSSSADLRRLCRLADLEATGCREFRLGGGEWPMRGFVIRAADRSVHAYVNRCAHLRYPLNYEQDRFLSHDASAIICFVHGALFEPHSGYCFAGPCTGLSLAQVPILIDGDEVLLGEGLDPEEFAARYA
jgi:nitrite reductase/ring-hydroxylating ferredoxin subunit